MLFYLNVWNNLKANVRNANKSYFLEINCKQKAWIFIIFCERFTW